MNEQRMFSLPPTYCLRNVSVVLEKENGEVKTGLFLVEKNSEEPADDETTAGEKEIETAALLDSLIENARNVGATDIHIGESGIRFSVNGLLKKKFNLDYQRAAALVRRIKLLARLNVLGKRYGQFVYIDGDESPVFVRVSCVPSVSVSGEGDIGVIVLRILDTKRMPFELATLGFTSAQVAVVEQLCSLPDGLVLICGPTGSGKSTTAGAMLETIRSIKNDSRKIVSLEEPPAYALSGVADVIMIGEIRDELTAKTAVQAAMTGHLVIATMSVGTVSQAVLRLYDLGQEPVAVHVALHGIIVQHIDNGKMEARIRVLLCENGAVPFERNYPLFRPLIAEEKEEA